jgi:hypothetical protein
MTVTLDKLDVAGKKHLVIAAVIIGAMLSHITWIGRVVAKYTSVGKLHTEDEFMLAALVLSCGMIWAEFYGEH